MVDGLARGELLLGQWARSGEVVGLIAALDAETVTLFDPGERTRATFPAADVQALPAGGVTVTVSVELPVPHGVDEHTLRRWVASLTDPHLRDRAYAALVENQMDEGAALPSVRVEVRPVESGSVCLCGARSPAPAGAQIVCTNCGRLSVGAPVPPA